MKTNHNKVLTYRFNKQIMAEIETIKTELLTHLKAGEATNQLLERLISKQHSLEHGKSISRGKAIAKLRRQEAGISNA